MLVPAQYSFRNVNEGVVAELIVMVEVILEAHCPLLGVNV